jgi:hypothetical protein
VLFSVLDFGLKFGQLVCSFFTETSFIKRVLLSQEMDVLFLLLEGNSEFDFNQVVDSFSQLNTVADSKVDAVKRFKDFVPLLKCEETFLRIDYFEK